MFFQYFSGNESEQFSFIKIPKIFFTDERFESLSFGAKILYGLLLDRMSLSRKNKWYDKEKRVYVIYTIESIQEDFSVSKTVAVKFMKELESFGLIEKKRRPNAAAMIYVKNFIAQKNAEEESGENGSPNYVHPEVQNKEVQKVEIPNRQETEGLPESGLPVNRPSEVQNLESNKIDNIINYLFSSSSGMEEDDVKRYIKEKINYHGVDWNGYDRVFVDRVIGCLAKIFCESKGYESINGKMVSMEEIQKRIAENINEENFWLVLKNMRVNGVGTIYNLQKYVMACFYKLVRIERPEKNRAGKYMQYPYDFEKLEKELLGKQE